MCRLLWRPRRRRTRPHLLILAENSVLDRPLFSGGRSTQQLVAGSTMVVASPSERSTSNGSQCQLVCRGPTGAWTVEIEDTGELLEMDPTHLRLPLFAKPFVHGVARAWRSVAAAPSVGSTAFPEQGKG